MNTSKTVQNIKHIPIEFDENGLAEYVHLKSAPFSIYNASLQNVYYDGDPDVKDPRFLTFNLLFINGVSFDEINVSECKFSKRVLLKSAVVSTTLNIAVFEWQE